MAYLEALRAAIQARDPGQPCDAPERTCSGDYAVWRFLSAWRHALACNRPLGADHAVLLRQIARWHASEPHIGEVPPTLERFLPRAGISVSALGTLRAIPFAPAWLTETSIDRARGIDGLPERRRLQESTPGEQYLTSLGFEDWHSPAQKEAVWTALTAPPRSTTLVALPTGAGKSLCFQLAARFSDGLTVVVVPTVALAIDHWKSARSIFSEFAGVNPEYFAAGDSERDPAEVIERVRRRECRLLFTSPESCVGRRFRQLLAKCAADGWLENLVIDEAHLVDTWGVYFRVDFQLLSPLRRQWLKSEHARVRTLLLSATFTTECRAVLRRLFSEHGTPWREFLSQRLRPEMTYYVQHLANNRARTDAVIEAVWHLPRPAIVYTTTRADAVALTDRLRAEGFERLGCFHGDTPSNDRRDLLDAWRENRIDLMVATSAFGLGVDKQDVRAVVHACLPEDLHRYYQEVGRGGRDGYSAICLLLSADGDIALARDLAPKLLLPETLQRRWAALWATAEALDEYQQTYRVRLDAKPANLRGSRTGRRNVSWNKRLLLQLVRAGRLDLEDVHVEPAPADSFAGGNPPRRTGFGAMPGSVAAHSRVGARNDDDPIDAATGAIEAEYIDPAIEVGAADAKELAEWAVVRLHFTPNTSALGALIEEVRAQELETMNRGLDLMLRYVDGAHCVSHALTELYGAGTARSCGGCPACRARGRRLGCPPLPIPLSADSAAEQVVVADVPNPRSVASQRAFVTLVTRVLRKRGVRRFLCASEAAPLLRTLLAAVANPMQRFAYRLDVLDSPIPFLVDPAESVAVFHIGSILGVGLRHRRGRVIYHLITSDTAYLDPDERRPLEGSGAQFYPTPDLWLQEKSSVH
jgi:ATP-dependent DNA helicase RecQ